LFNTLQQAINGIPGIVNITLSIGVASFSSRLQLYISVAFLAQAKACYSISSLNDKAILIKLVPE
jgi:hypothetical protein